MGAKAMNRKWKSFAAAGALAALLGCMKSGDGVGLDSSGKVVPFCTLHPGDPSCAVAVDPCLKDPLSQACSLATCLKNPAAAGCQVTDCAKTPTAPGCSVDVCAANPAAEECRPKMKFAEVLPILKDQCQQCHSPGGSGYTMGRLNLTPDSAFANLVGVPVWVQAVAPGWVRVKPGFPDSSLFLLKLTGGAQPELPSGNTYGSGMPLGKPSLPDVSIQTIRKWIADGALK
jgi:hypothetical protein